MQDGLQYLQCLIGEVLRQAGLSSNIIKGLAAFDPFIMFRRPIEVALRHFDFLYDTFLCRSWVTAANQVACRDEYVSLLDYLRANYSPDFVVTDSARDLIDFLINLDFLQSRRLLIYLFKLSCLCITTISPQYPSVSMGRIDTSGYCDRFTDVVLPSQSHLFAVAGSVPYCRSDAQLANFSLLTASFGQTAFSPDYDRWDNVDQVGRSKIYKSLLFSYRKVLSGPKGVSVQEEAGETTTTIADQSVLMVPSSTKRRKMERSASRSATSSVLGDSVQSTSTPYLYIGLCVRLDCKLCSFSVVFVICFCFASVSLYLLCPEGFFSCPTIYSENTFLGLVKRKK